MTNFDKCTWLRYPKSRSSRAWRDVRMWVWNRRHRCRGKSASDVLPMFRCRPRNNIGFTCAFWHPCAWIAFFELRNQPKLIVVNGLQKILVFTVAGRTLTVFNSYQLMQNDGSSPSTRPSPSFLPFRYYSGVYNYSECDVKIMVPFRENGQYRKNSALFCVLSMKNDKTPSW